MTNTKLLASYANFLRENKPEYTEIVDALAIDATSDGPIYQGLKSRLSAATTAAEAAPAKGEKEVEEAWMELELLKGAADPKDLRDDAHRPDQYPGRHVRR